MICGYALVYTSFSCSSVGLLYASLLLIKRCPKIWSIQFAFTPATSRFVCKNFLRLCADTLASPILRNACLTLLENDSLGIRLTSVLSHVLNSGVFAVISSGSILLLPLRLAFRYSLSASMASFPMKVFATILDFCVIMVIGIISSPLSSGICISP